MIDIERLSVGLRRLAIDLSVRKIRIACFANSQQSQDLSLPSNCGGFGRLHHFRRFQGEGWPLDPLPIDPALHALGLPDSDDLLAQVFQCAVCNLRCWYCYVDRNLINGQPEHSRLLSAQEILQLYLSEAERAPMIDLSGGQPDLVPEWILWIVDAVDELKLGRKIYLWSDDNLTTDFLWRFLTKNDIARLASYPNYGRVGCFKGFDEHSFTFNTGARAESFKDQFTLMRRLIESGLDVYGYVTFTSDQDENLSLQMANFVDRLQSEVHPLFPLRTVPQRIFEFTPTKGRIEPSRRKALEVQNEAACAWQEEMEKRFSPTLRNKPIYGHSLDVRETRVKE